MYVHVCVRMCVFSIQSLNIKESDALWEEFNLMHRIKYNIGI